MNESKTTDEVINDATIKADSLRAERMADRRGGLHTEDKRIPTEISDQLYEVGHRMYLLDCQNTRMAEGIERNKEHLRALESVHRKLHAELNIATFIPGAVTQAKEEFAEYQKTVCSPQ